MTNASLPQVGTPGVRSGDWLTYGQLALVSAIWGGTFVAGRGLADQVPPLAAAAVRFILASVVLGAVLLSKTGRLPRVTAKQGLALVGLGLVGICLYNVCFFYGLQRTDASRASLIVATNPAVVALVAFAFQGEALTKTRVTGIGLCLAGAAVVILGRSADTSLGSGADPWIGDALIFGCVLSWVAYTVFCKALVRDLGALPTVTYSVFAGATLLVLTSAVTRQWTLEPWTHLTPFGFASLLYLGLFGSALAYVLYYDGIRKVGPSRAGAFIALNPVTSVVAGGLILGEKITGSIVAGGGLVLVGLVLAVRRSRSARGDVSEGRAAGDEPS